MRVDDTVPITFFTSPSEYGCHDYLSQTYLNSYAAQDEHST